MDYRRVAYETARLRLARYQIEGVQARGRAVEHAASVSAEALGVERVGVWLLKERGQRLICAGQYVRSRRERQSGQVLQAELYPSYFQALRERRVIAADDAAHHPSTRELAASYLRPAGISSLLDAPMIREGSVFGVVRHEHVGPVRSWTQTELEFATAVADSLALIFEQADRLELEAALQEQAEQRQESQKMEALGRIACAVAHDFSNVLSTIAMTAGTMDTGVSQDELHTLVAEVEQAVARGTSLTQQLLAFGKQRSDGELVCVDVEALVQRMQPMLRTAIGRGTQLKFETALHEGSQVLAEPSQLEQVIINLCLNARDAQGGGGEIALTLREADVADEVALGSLILQVRDNGAGMDEQALARVFEPYFSTKPSGGGLGLATVYGIVKRCGGVVRAISEPGAGTTMRVALPRPP